MIAVLPIGDAKRVETLSRHTSLISAMYSLEDSLVTTVIGHGNKAADGLLQAGQPYSPLCLGGSPGGRSGGYGRQRTGLWLLVSRSALQHMGGRA